MPLKVLSSRQLARLRHRRGFHMVVESATRCGSSDAGHKFGFWEATGISHVIRTDSGRITDNPSVIRQGKGCRPTGSYRRWPVARTFKRSFVFEAELATNRLFLSDDTHSFERRTYSSRCLTSRNLCFEPSYNWSDKGFAHPSPEQRQ
jgi:hypothetical protein